MGNFNQAIPFTRKEEGGWCNTPGDSGGETYCSISRKNNPTFPGWPIIDSHKPLHYNEVINDSTLDEMVNNYLKENYWDKICGDSITSQKISSYILYNLLLIQ